MEVMPRRNAHQVVEEELGGRSSPEVRVEDHSAIKRRQQPRKTPIAGTQTLWTMEILPKEVLPKGWKRGCF